MASLAIARPRVRPNHQSIRSRLEASIDAAIAALDQLDGDPDLEDTFDQEAACDDEGHDSDREQDVDYEAQSVPLFQLDQTNRFALPWGR